MTRLAVCLATSFSLLLAACGSLSTRAPVAYRSPGSDTTKPPAKPAADTNATGSANANGSYVLKQGGGYYKDDGPGDNPPANLEAIQDVVPKAEPLHRFANRPYSVFGKQYKPLQVPGTYTARGRASWYGKRFHGQKTSTGEIYDMYAMSAAHPTLPLPSYARVTNLANGKSVVVRVNDRGPFHAGRIIDLSWTAASKLDYVGHGSAMVEVVSLAPGAPLALAASPNTDIGRSSPDVTSVSASLSEVDDAHGAWLQLGAFGSRDNAEALKSRLARELGELGSKLVVRPSGSLFRVQLGPWANSQEARNIAANLVDLLEIKPVLVQP